MEKIAEKPDQPSALDQLKSMSVEQRLIFILQQLDRLQKSNLVKCHPVALTKKQEMENVSRNAAVKAYKDTTNFITALFGEELRVVLMKKEVVN